LPDFSWYNIPKRVKMYPIATEKTNGHKIDQNLPLQDPPEVTQIYDFGF
jgi:hypothetical protein